MYMCIFHYFNYYLPDFVTAICLGFIFCFLFFIFVVESLFLTREQALSLVSGSTDFKTIDYQRTNTESEVAQSCLTLCDPMDGSLPGSSVYGIFQARVLEWVAISFSRGSYQHKDQTWISLIAGSCLTI